MESTELGRRESGMKREEQRVVVVGSRWREREEEKGKEGRESKEKRREGEREGREGE